MDVEDSETGEGVFMYIGAADNPSSRISILYSGLFP